MFAKFVANLKDKSEIDPRAVTYYSPGAMISEQYRNMRTHICSLNGGEIFRSILISSANRYEGKSVTALNLAIALAEEKDKKVALIDADLRYPAIEKMLNIKVDKGLSDYLKNTALISDILVKTSINNLTLLPAGNIPSNPAELLSPQKMKELIGEMENSFNYIILDTPAIIPFADARILAPCADGVLLAVQAGKTRREVVSRAQELMRNVRAKLLGVVLTQVEYYIPEYIHRHL